MRSASTTILAVAAAFVLAAVAVRIADVLVGRMLRALEIVSAENRAAVHARARALRRAMTLLAYGIAAAASVSFALTRLGIAEPRWGPATAGRWLLTHGINILVIVVGAWVVVRAATLAIEHLQFKLGRAHADTDLEWRRRAATLSGILTNVVTVSVGFVAVLMLLRELSIDVVPILTGAGIAGLAIGFGAQNLVRDVISGFFLILEDQVRVGDSVRINGVDGTVEQINLRTIVLRDGDGAVHVFPNGTVTALANLSKAYAYAVVDFRIAYQENVDRVMAAIEEVGAAMARDPAWAPHILAPLENQGVQSLADGFTTMRVRFKTAPLSQGHVASELRRRLVAAFVARGIRPYGEEPS